MCFQVGVKAYDKIMNEKFDIFGKVVVNCTGPASDVIRKMADPSVRPLVTQASGSHAVLPKHYAPSGFGMIIPKTSDGRVLFFLPWEVRFCFSLWRCVDHLAFLIFAGKYDYWNYR